MSTQATLQAAFILHHRPFRDSSVVADLITPDYGLVSVIARGARSASSKRRVLLQPFRPLLASWTGRSELRTLTTLEESGQALTLSAEPLACAYYITELALRLLSREQANISAFALYARTLEQLAGLCDTAPAVAEPGIAHAQATELCLREFELALLDSLGLLPDFSHCDKDHGRIEPGLEYQFHPPSGQATRAPLALDSIAVSGRTLLALGQRSLAGRFDQELLAQAKRLMRALLQMHLGNRPLKSREVFRQLRQLADGGGSEPADNGAQRQD